MGIKEKADSVPRDEGLSNATACSSFIQNMSCRPRTTVRSKGLTNSKVPAWLKGEKIVVEPRMNIPACLKHYARENPEMSIPIFSALMTLGHRRTLKTYRHFIDSRPGHEQSLMKWVSRVPDEITGLPAVGFIKRPGTSDGIHQARLIKSLHATLFIMARANRSVYIRNKSPLLSLITTDRQVSIIFADRRR
jgi:hypothetical protein